MPSGRLQISLLGSLQVTINDDPVTHFRSDSVRVLLALLARRQGKLQRRDALASHLAANSKSDQDARKRLRVVLTRLRNAIGDRDATPPYLTIDRKTILLRDQKNVWVDVTEFDQLLAQVAEHTHRDVAHCPTCLQALQRAFALYRGDMLDGLHFESASWESWLRGEREHLRAKLLIIGKTLGGWHHTRNEWHALQTVAQRLLQVEPWLEEPHRWLMEAYWRLGELHAALQQYQDCVTVLRTELDVAPSTETEQLFKQIHRANSRFRQSDSADNLADYLHNLPRTRTGFFGRNQTLPQVERLLTDHAYRLVTITGEGGIGKSRLAQEVGHRLLPSYPDGVWFVSLIGATPSGGDQILAAIAQTLDFSFSQTLPPLAQLTNFLRRAELLLILDNFENVIEDASVVLELLDRTERLAILCTSRIVLNFGEEVVVPLQGLELPDSTLAPESNQQVWQYQPAIALFIERARRANVKFALTADNLPHVIRICRWVNGSPLGIELAAAWVRSRSVAQISAAIIDSADFLATRRRDVPQRHRSMRAVFDSSWALLTPAEQTLFATLSVFHGGFSAEVAKVIANATLIDLEMLVEQSLLRFEAGRYAIHELLREFGERHQSAPAQLRQQHAAYFLTVLADQTQALHGMNPQIAIARIAIDERNIWQAWQWACHHNDPALLTCAAPLTDYYLRNNRLDAVDALLKMALQGPFGQSPAILIEQARYFQRLTHHDEALRCVDRLLTHAVDAEQRGQAYLIQVRCFEEKGEVDAWLAALERALHFAHQAASPALRAAAYGRAGVAAAVQKNDLLAALEFFQKALVQYEQLQDAENIGWQASNIGAAFLSLGRLTEARRALERAQQTFAIIGVKTGQYTAHLTLGHICLDEGLFQQAHDHYSTALAYYRRLNIPKQVTAILGSMGNLLCKTGHPESAEQYLEEALRLCQAHGLRQMEDHVQLFLGRAQALRGAFRQAQESFQQALSIAHLNQDRSVVAAIQLGWGDLLAERNTPAAYYHYKQVLLSEELAHQPHLKAEGLAGLYFLTVKNLTGLREHWRNQLRTHMQMHAQINVAGFENDLLFYWRCYQIFYDHDADFAAELLAQAYTTLRARIDQFSAETDRQTFIERIPHHAAILNAYSNQ